MKQPAINMRLPQAALVPVTTHVEAMIPSSRNKITKAACGKPRPVSCNLNKQIPIKWIEKGS